MLPTIYHRHMALLALLALVTVACSARGTVDDEGAFVGQVTRVWSDGLNMDTPGNNIRIDTWQVCGDRTAANISVGDTVHIWATRDLFSYEAWRIQTPTGDPACS